MKLYFVLFPFVLHLLSPSFTHSLLGLQLLAEVFLAAGAAAAFPGILINFD